MQKELQLASLGLKEEEEEAASISSVALIGCGV
jgi:hypothetical protein